MTDRANKIMLSIVLFGIIAGFVLLFVSTKHNMELQTTKQAVITAQTSVDKAKSQYVTVKERNIQNEQTIAKNTVKTLYCEQYSTDADILIGFAELVQRAKEYNARQLNDGEGVSARP